MTTTTLGAPDRVFRVPRVERDPQWVWEVVGAHPVEPTRPPRAAAGPRWWLVAAAPVLAPLALMALYGLHVPVPLSLLLALSLVPAVLVLRRGLARDARLALVAAVAVAVAILAGTAVAGRLGPVALSRQDVQLQLYQRVFDGSIPLDAATASVSCPELSRVWHDAAVTCVVRDDRTTARVGIRAATSGGRYSWRLER